MKLFILMLFGLILLIISHILPGGKFAEKPVPEKNNVVKCYHAIRENGDEFKVKAYSVNVGSLLYFRDKSAQVVAVCKNCVYFTSHDLDESCSLEVSDEEADPW